MIIPWLTYCLVVSTLLGVAALAAERALRAQGWAGRWAWAGAMAGSLALPLAVWLSPSGAAPAAGPLPALPGAYVMETLSPLALDGGGPSIGELLLGCWAGASGLLLLYVIVATLRLRSERRSWRPREVEGVPVLVSKRTGPAAMGLMRARIVVPEWALELDARLRRLLVLHEAEHLRAGDPQLAVAGLLLCVALPWNLPLWWQLHRLRLALEVDCDARVLRRSPDVGAYGALLLEVCQRRSRLAVGLAESRSVLERRIRMMTRTRTGRRTAQAVALALVSGVALAVACETPGPAEPGTPERQPSELAEGPQFTPMTVPPKLLNPDEVRQALDDLYPPLLREAGITGTVNVWLLIDPEGEVVDRRVNARSGHPALDAAALRVSERMEFTPAYAGDQRVRAWIAQDIRFEAETGDRVTPPRGRAGAGADPPEPIGSLWTQGPRLVNAEDVRRAIAEGYPRLLRDAGIEGAVEVQLEIDRDGVVRDVWVSQSPHPAFDEPAIEIARTMRFEPAEDRGRPAPARLVVDVAFELEP